MDKSCLDLPHMAELFDVLRKGKHLCSEDGELFLTLRDNLKAYQILFKNLGFDFREHSRGFFYFRGNDQLSNSAEQISVFMFVLIESLATQGHPVEEALMTRRFTPLELPHFHSARSRQYMVEVGLPSEEDLSKLLRNMERLGFTDVAPDGSFRFRTPVCRFLDLCTDIINAENEEGEP